MQLTDKQHIEEMKTPLQELIEILKSEDMLPLPYPHDINELLEKEKQMVVDAVNSNKGINGWKDGEEYFNETF